MRRSFQVVYAVVILVAAAFAILATVSAKAPLGPSPAEPPVAAAGQIGSAFDGGSRDAGRAPSPFVDASAPDASIFPDAGEIVDGGIPDAAIPVRSH